eukprot:12491548-Alexandrium_andersonii.AAC.1
MPPPKSHGEVVPRAQPFPNRAGALIDIGIRHSPLCEVIPRLALTARARQQRWQHSSSAAESSAST